MRLVIILFALSISLKADPVFEKWSDLYRADLDFFEMSLELESGEKEVKAEAFIQVVWDKIFDSEKPENRIEATKRLSSIKVEDFSLAQKLKLFVMAKELDVTLSFQKNDFVREDWSREAILTYLSLKENYPSALRDILLPKNDLSESTFSEFEKSKGTDHWAGDQINSLLSYDPSFRGGFRNYKNGIRLYMFCRHNREYPCLMVMKDSSGDWVKDDQGRVWTQPKLAMSRRGLPSHQVNGETPQGVYTIDSVMPETNRQLVFGKYRRLILNFINQSRSEKDLLSLIPKSVQGMTWWRQSVVARDVGRSLLRIHGTGILNVDPASNWFPFFPTSGCVASRENTYSGVGYHDQRSLLDTMMMGMNLNPEYRNETRLKGLLYVVNLDSREEAVKEEDIIPYL